MCIRDRAITERIKGRFVERKPKENRKISLRIDLENSIKAQQSAGYEKWAKDVYKRQIEYQAHGGILLWPPYRR